MAVRASETRTASAVPERPQRHAPTGTNKPASGQRSAAAKSAAASRCTLGAQCDRTPRRIVKVLPKDRLAAPGEPLDECLSFIFVRSGVEHRRIVDQGLGMKRLSVEGERGRRVAVLHPIVA